MKANLARFCGALIGITLMGAALALMAMAIQ